MNIVVGVAVEAITEVVKYLASPITRHVSYLYHHKRNANDLRIQMVRLGEVTEDTQRLVNAAEMRGEVIRVVVRGWLEKVNGILSKETELQNALKEGKGCLQGGCSGLYQVGKNAKHMIDEVKELLNEGKTFVAAGVSDPSPLPPSLESIQMLDFQVYDSTKLAMDQIMNALKDEDFNMVGVYGIGGVGKTTLMKEVAKISKKDGFFDQVMMVIVSQNPDLKKIQGEIAENLGLQLTQESLYVRARILSERMKKEKRILLILDDLWIPLNLVEEVGIPYGNNYKVVLTTRQLEVCNQMKTQSNVEVKVLSEGDAWVLFKWAAGDRIEIDDTLRPVANQVVSECAGLPLAIVVIGSTLRDKDWHTWEDAASELKKSSSSTPDIEGVHKKIFCPLKWSYDFIDNDATRFCLLLCCMFPEDYSISVEKDLLPYVVGEGLFENVYTLTEAMNRLRTQMERLKRSCLLLEDDREGYVRMHDVIRDVCIWIASNEVHGFVVKSGRPLSNWHDCGEILRKCKRLSLMRSQITKLPNWIDCSQLVTLSLRGNRDLTEIPDPDGFFQGMISLKTLDLTYTSISSIPSSLCCLTDLRVLLISGSETFDVSLLGKLKKLEILRLFSCNVSKLLAEDVEELTNLKSLDLSWNGKLIIAPNTLSRLSLLEELNLTKSFDEWGEIFDEGSNNIGLSEVASLSALTTLYIRIWNFKYLSANNNNNYNNTIPIFRWENMTRFIVILGNLNWLHVYINGKKFATEVYICGISIPHHPHSDWVRWLIYLLERTEMLLLRECHGLSKYGLSSLIGAGGAGGIRVLNKLQILRVERCDDVEYLMSTTTNTTTVVDEAEEEDHHHHYHYQIQDEVPQQITTFSSSKKLYLQSLPKLKAICQYGSIPVPSTGGGGGGGGGFFNNLRSLYVSGCSSLISIIPSDLLANLPNLEQLEVRDCSKTTEVFNSNDQEGHHDQQATTLILPKLRRLELGNLLSLRTIWDGVVSPSSLLNLEDIFLNNLGVNFVFSLAMAQRLQQLKELEISDCPNMVQIISLFTEGEDDMEKEEANITCKHTVLFPQLRVLRLVNLPNLSMVSKRVLRSSSSSSHDCNYYWPSLETLKIVDCPNLKRLPVSPHTTATTLREIEVKEEWFNTLEYWDDDDDDDNDQNHHDKLQHLQERGVQVRFVQW